MSVLHNSKNAFRIFAALAVLSISGFASAGTVHGDLVKWHTVVVDFQGPAMDEMDSSPNPFLDYRLQVTFTGPSGVTYNIPGYFDGDGNGGGTGQVWRARFSPDEAGIWTYVASFRSGTDIAVSLNPVTGTAAWFDGDSGSFSVAGLDSNADGFLRFGRLESIGEYYFKFRDGGYWIKGGMDSPENFLGFDGFDNTIYARHDYNTHAQDWTATDPDWDSPYTGGTTQDGRPIIGVLNYLSSQNLNSIYFMPMDIGADGKDSWPYASESIDRNGSSSNDNLHFDVSKMQQWSTVLDHAQRKEIFLHFVLSDRETANKNELDNATLGVERKLLYRELIARFGHFNGLQWNISEEYNLTLPLHPDVIKEFAQYINDVDAYDHPVTVHNHGNTYVSALGPFVGDTRFGVFSVQTWQRPDDISFAIEHFRTASANAGHIIPVAVDESIGIDQISPANYRKRAIWDAMLSGGGHELFVRYQDSNLDNFRAYEETYEYLWFARKFVLENLPFWEMQPDDNLVSGENTVHGGAEVFMKLGEVYAIYFPAADGLAALDIGTSSGSFEQRWYNPRTGQFEGILRTFDAEFSIDIGAPPSSPNEDWTTIITSSNSVNNATVFQQDGSGQGLVSMEAENFNANTPQGSHDWTVVTPGGESGFAAMQAMPNIGGLVNSGYSLNSPQLDFEVDFTESGTHYVWLRGLGDSDAGSANDSVHVGLDGIEVTTSDRMTGFNSSWTWTRVTMDGPVAELEVAAPGVHTVNVWMREDGLIIDKVVLTTDAAFDPTSFGPDGPPESVRGAATLPLPAISPASGSYFGSVDVTITAEPGSSIYYTTDGSAPTMASTLYGAPFTINADTTVRAFAVQSGWNDSGVASADYVISVDLLPPTISPPGGAYLDSVTVSITETAGASIYYTTDGSVPTTASPLYVGSFVLTSDTTVRAITAMSGFTDSPEASEVYTISTIGGGGGLFLQSTAGQGLVSMEAENFSANTPQGSHDWTVVTPGGESGFAAMQAMPNIGGLVNSGYSLNSPQLDFEVDFTESGTHYVWLRGLGDSDAGSANDSVHVGLDGIEVTTSDRMTGFNSSWTWTRVTMDGPVAELEVAAPGVHTVNVWMREDGLIIDKVVLTTDAAFDPTSFGPDGPPESVRGAATLPLPAISPASGSYFGSVDVTITAEPGSSIYYTTDGSAPTMASTLYGAPFTINADTTVRAFAVQSGWNDSGVASADYVISVDLLPPTISPPGGAYLDSVTVSITETAGASIYYTTDGSVPTTASPLYVGSFVLTSDTTVRAITAMSGFTDSPEASEVYTISTIGGGGGLFLQSTAGQGLVSMEAENFSANTPQGSHDWTVVTPGGESGFAAMQAMPNIGGLVNSGYSLNSPQLDFEVDFTESGTHYVWLRGLGDSDAGSANDSVHVGLDGIEVTTSDRMTGFNSSWTWTRVTMDGPVAELEVAAPGVHTVNVWMREDGLIIDKVVLTTDAAFDPTSFGPDGPPESVRGAATLPLPAISPASGSYFGSVDVTITAEPGSSIYYTTDGSAPTMASTLYGAPFTINADTTVRAFAVQSGWNDSGVASADYVISVDLLPPTISPPGGAYLDSVTVSITETAGASIYYTTDGSVPTTASPLYVGSFVLTSDTTVRAITAMSGFTDSPEASEVYTISTIGGGGGLFLQSTAGQGLVSMEAENFSANTPQGSHDWTVVTPGGESGFAAMQAMPNIGGLVNSGYSLNSPQLDFEVDFTESGTHYVWLRGLGDSDAGSANDSVHVGLDGIEVTTSDRMTGFNSSWTWTRVTMDGPVAELEVAAPGVHTVNVWMREDGLIIDKVVLTTDAAFDPTSFGPDGPPESVRGAATLPLPAISPASGSYFGSVDVTITAEPGSSIYYTTDGSAPTMASTLYGAPFTINADTTVRAFAVQSGWNDSGVASADYVISVDLLPPTISPPGGAYLDSVTVSITETAGASIYYTTDGSVPTTASPLYVGSFVLTSDTTVRAITAMSGFTDSPEASEVYTISTIGGGGGLFLQSTAGQGLVSMEAENFSANTPQGSHDWTVVTPGGESGFAAMQAMPNIGGLVNSGYSLNSPQIDFLIEFTESGTHYVWLRGLGDSDGASVNDSVHVGLDGIEVTTSDRMTGFNSSWTWTRTTMDGGAVAQFPVAAPGVHTLNVWMREDGLIIDKVVLTTDATFDPTSFGPDGPPESARAPGIWPAPVFSPLGGTFSQTLTVSMTGFGSSTIHYTTNGSAPDSTSPVYPGPIVLSGDAYLRAISVGDGNADSPVTDGIFTQTACQDIRILPLGDSITLGKDARSLPPVGARVSYRRELFFSLVEAGYNVDFVGSVDEGASAVPVFDSNHEGHAGATDDDIAVNIYQYLVNNPADYILLHIGTNSTDTDAMDVEAILDEIDRYNTDIHVVVARIINQQTFNPTVATFNNALDDLVVNRIAAGDKLSIIDMESALVYPDDLQDNLHPNISGYSKMADVWFEELDDRLPACVLP